MTQLVEMQARTAQIPKLIVRGSISVTRSSRVRPGQDIASGLAWHRRPRPPRRVTVPDVRGLFYNVCQEVAGRLGMQVTPVRLTERPMPVDGLIVDQDPPPGVLRRGGQLTVRVWHPPAR
jgi:hypothetical protein